MIRVLKSNHTLAVRFPALPVVDAAGRELRDDDGNARQRVPEVTLPRGSHTARERAAGMIAYIELDDAAQARLADDLTFRGMLKRGEYEWTAFSRIPIDMLPEDQRRDAKVRALEQENALLRNELRKNDIAVPVFNPGPVPVEAAQAPDAEDLVKTDVSVLVDDPAGASRPAFGADTRITLPVADGGSPFPH